MRVYHFITLITLLSLIFLSCSKGSREKDREAPVVTIGEPANNAIVAGNQLLHIRGTVSDNEYIHEIHIEISDLQTGQEYLHVHLHPTTRSHIYNQPFTPVNGIKYLVRVIAEDPSNNVSSQKIEITAQ